MNKISIVNVKANKEKGSQRVEIIKVSHRVKGENKMNTKERLDKIRITQTQVKTE